MKDEGDVKEGAGRVGEGCVDTDWSREPEDVERAQHSPVAPHCTDRRSCVSSRSEEKRTRGSAGEGGEWTLPRVVPGWAGSLPPSPHASLQTRWDVER